MDFAVTWTIVAVAGAIALVDVLFLKSRFLYRLADATVYRLFPPLRARAARRHWAGRMKSGARDVVANAAAGAGQERLCLAIAEEEMPAAQAARWAAALGLARDADRIFRAAFQDAVAKGDEVQAIALALDGGLSLEAAEYYEKRGDLRHAGEHFGRAGRPLDAARCFEAAGDPVRAVDVLARAGLRAELEALAGRTTDPLARAAGRRALGSA